VSRTAKVRNFRGRNVLDCGALQPSEKGALTLFVRLGAQSIWILAEPVPSTATRAVLLNVSGFLERLYMILDRVAAGTRCFYQIRDRHAAARSAQFENLYRKCWQSAEDQPLALDVLRKLVLLLPKGREKVA
jgi:hypothetical protein